MGGKKCTKCGAEMQKGAKFCKKCGRPINENAITLTENEHKVNKKTVYALLWTLGALILIVLGAMLYSEYSEERETRLAKVIETPPKATIKQTKIHNYGLSTTHHHLVGTFEDASGVYPVELDFTSNGKTVTDVVYKNVTYGGKIRMTCSFFDQRRLTVEGKDGRNKFVISLECIDKNGFKGTAKDGAKKLLVVMSADCSHK